MIAPSAAYWLKMIRCCLFCYQLISFYLATAKNLALLRSIAFSLT